MVKRFSKSSLLGSFTKICKHSPIFVTLGQNNGHFTWRSTCVSASMSRHLAKYLFEQRNVLNKSCEEKCTQYGQFTFTISLMVYEINEQELLHYVYPSKHVDSTVNSVS